LKAGILVQEEEAIAGQRFGKHVPGIMNTHAKEKKRWMRVLNAVSVVSSTHTQYVVKGK
jgi:hypothetical protein